MFVLDCNIKIGDYTFKRVHDVQIVKSVDLLSDTAVIKMPASAFFDSGNKTKERKQLENEIKVGMPVSITLSYKNVFEEEEFTGFVRHVRPKNHIVHIECEDAVYHIRKTRINKNFKKTTLKEVLAHILDETNNNQEDANIELGGNIPDVNFEKFAIKSKNGAQALKKIKDEYGLSIFLDDEGKLHAGLRMDINLGKSSSYHVQKNVVSHDLKYVKKEDVELYVKVIGVQKDNTKIETVVGEQTGEQRTLHFYNLKSEKELKKRGEAELDKLKYTGYRGDLTSFLIPYTTRGMGVSITDNRYPSRNGQQSSETSNATSSKNKPVEYFVPKVTTTFGQNGARRKVELGAIILPKDKIG
ncbi:late control protein [Tenacibaculum jejuense]|uniref:Phage late control protein D protein n=1 Tax=Tenacibaculum jejuense TaxID=584609 RepID=A0A238UDG9_9FLAO|nr:late control protein [Tenacibaculum jejuense]SNR16534.1 Phage late control protein D protein [Tenacibaculum jejuense]